VKRSATVRPFFAGMLAAITASCSGDNTSWPYDRAPTIDPVTVQASENALLIQREEALSSGKLITDSVGFRMVSTMTFVGLSQLLVVDQNTSPHAVLIDIDAAQVSRFGVHGVAPGELSEPILQGVASSDRSVTLYEPGTSVSSSFDLSPITGAAPARFSARRVIRLPSRTRYLAKIGGTRQLALGDYPEGVGLVLENGNIVAQLRVDHPFDSLDIPNAAHRAYLNDHSSTLGSEDLPGVAIAYKYFPRLTVLKNALDTQFVADRAEAWVRPYVRDSNGSGVSLLRSGKFQYVAVTANEHEIFGLYCECHPGERFATTIHVYDWRAELIAVLRVDVPIYSLAVSADGCRIAGAAWQDRPGVRIWERKAVSKGPARGICRYLSGGEGGR